MVRISQINSIKTLRECALCLYNLKGDVYFKTDTPAFEKIIVSDLNYYIDLFKQGKQFIFVEEK